MHRSNKFYTTQHEIKFIDNLGKHRPDYRGDPKELLEKYLAAMPQRWNWAGMDPAEIEAHVRMRLASY